MIDFKHRLYLVTDEKACLNRDFFWVIEQALKGGVDLVQIREKQLSTADFTEKALRLKDLCERYQVPLLVNDNVEVAKNIEAFGLHIGQSDMPISEAESALGREKPIGLSVELMEHLTDFAIHQAWYLGISPIFSTPTKTDTYAEWGLEGLKAVRAKTNKPLVAIGNIKLHNVGLAISHGADAAAVVSEICSAKDPAKAAELLRNQIEKHLHSK
ncbi:thiamine phosphate synthase [Pedobacter sp. AW1-32]|uniref:thiamine phosphate synthase n=1 Tax=Pedobacter sp. AW1-32 TaxID=3383026 RepID=UPI003FF0CA33